MMSACNPDRLPASASPGSGSSATSATTFATSTSASGPGRFRGAGGRAGLDGPGHGDRRTSTTGSVFAPNLCLGSLCHTGYILGDILPSATVQVRPIYWV